MLAHGFTQNAGCWGPFAALVGTEVEVRAVDLPGHGTAPPARGLAHAAHHLGAVGGWGAYLGYSLGGRVALHLALAQPELVTALVLIGAHPGIEDPRQRAERRAADEALADRLEVVGVATFLDDWLAQPLFASLPVDAAAREAREANTATGLAGALRTLGTGVQEPLWNRLAAVRVPVLVLAGERDQKYTRIGRETAAAIGAHATFAPVPGAGHAAHLEQPEVVAGMVLDFLSRPAPAPPPAAGP